MKKKKSETTSVSQVEDSSEVLIKIPIIRKGDLKEETHYFTENMLTDLMEKVRSDPELVAEILKYNEDAREAVRKGAVSSSGPPPFSSKVRELLKDVYEPGVMNAFMGQINGFIIRNLTSSSN
jgi:hypothetical protein